MRFGSDAGAGEIIVLRPRGGLVRHADTLVIPLLVPDAPVVAWWPNEAPANLSKDLLGSMAQQPHHRRDALLEPAAHDGRSAPQPLRRRTWTCRGHA